jgi:hypothetical protein
MIISSLIFFDASFPKKGLSILGKCFHIPLVLFENGKEKAQHFNALYKTKIVLISCFIAFQLLSPFAIYVIQMNCFDRRIPLLCYVDGKSRIRYI